MSQARARRKLHATFRFTENGNNWLKWDHQNYFEANVKVSIIIPTKDGIDLLEKCIKSVFATVSYPKFEIIIINNESLEERSLEYLKK